MEPAVDTQPPQLAVIVAFRSAKVAPLSRSERRLGYILRELSKEWKDFGKMSAKRSKPRIPPGRGCFQAIAKHGTSMISAKIRVIRGSLLSQNSYVFRNLGSVQSAVPRAGHDFFGGPDRDFAFMYGMVQKRQVWIIVGMPGARIGGFPASCHYATARILLGGKFRHFPIGDSIMTASSSHRFTLTSYLIAFAIGLGLSRLVVLPSQKPLSGWWSWCW